MGKNKEPKLKYDFKTGKTIIKVEKSGYKYLGRGEIGKLKYELIDGKKFYYIQYDIGRSSFSKDKKKFVKAEYWEEDVNWNTKWVEQGKAKKELVFNTKIEIPQDRMLTNCEIQLGKSDDIHFFTINESNIIRDLQLKLGDKIKVTIEKISQIK